MNKKINLRKIIAESGLVDSLKVFLLVNINEFNAEQIDWLTKNLY